MLGNGMAPSYSPAPTPERPGERRHDGHVSPRLSGRLSGRLSARLRLHQLRVLLGVVPFLLLTPFRRRWARTWGADDSEVAATLPGDDLLDRVHFRATRAIDVAAPPHQVWPWVVQMGCGRAGFYSVDLLDNLGRPSAEEILPQWQGVAVGDLAAPMTPRPTERTSYRVAHVEAPHVLVWANPDSVWSWRLTPTPDGTRVVTRLQQRYRRRPSDLAVLLALELGDFAMFRVMLRGLRRRAEVGPTSGV